MRLYLVMASSEDELATRVTAYSKCGWTPIDDKIYFHATVFGKTVARILTKPYPADNGQAIQHTEKTT